MKPAQPQHPSLTPGLRAVIRELARLQARRDFEAARKAQQQQ